MNVLIDVHALAGNKTGKAFYTHNLLSGLSLFPQAKKHTFHLFSPVKFDLDFVSPSHFIWKISSTKKNLFFLDLIREANNQKYDVFWSPTSIIPLAFGRGKKVGVIYDLIALKKRAFRKNLKATIIESLLTKKAVGKSTALITISQNTHDELIEMFPETKRKSFIIPGSAKSYSACVPKKKIMAKYNLGNKKYLLFVGTLEPRKNIPNTLKAYRLFLDRLKSENKQPPLFILAGGKGWNFNQIAQTIKKLRLNKQVRILGYIPNQDLPALYQNCQYFVYIPYHEGFGLPIIEAVSFGKACLTSRTSSLPEAVGPCGIQVDPNDIMQMTEAMHQLWTNDRLRKKYEQKTREWIKQFSNEKNIEKLLSVFEFARKT